jgi:PPOX class probable F420-dependent enzyme
VSPDPASPTIPASHHDLVTAPGVAILTTLGPKGEPQSTAVWYLLDDGQLRISLNGTRQKLKNLRARPKAVLFWVDSKNSARTLEVRASASVAEDRDFSFRAKVSAHYGVDLSAFDRPGDERYVVTLALTKVNAIDMSRGAH